MELSTEDKKKQEAFETELAELFKKHSAVGVVSTVIGTGKTSHCDVKDCTEAHTVWLSTAFHNVAKDGPDVTIIEGIMGNARALCQDALQIKLANSTPEVFRDVLLKLADTLKKAAEKK